MHESVAANARSAAQKNHNIRAEKKIVCRYASFHQTTAADTADTAMTKNPRGHHSLTH